MIKKINIFLVLLLLLLSISVVSAAAGADSGIMSTNETISDSVTSYSDEILFSDVENNGLLTSSSHVVTSSNYNAYFNSKGQLIPSAVNAGDTLEIDGSFSGKEFKFDKTVNVVGTSTNDMKNCVFTFYNGASGSTISNLKIANTQDGKYGIFLNNASNCIIQGCIINNTGMSSYDICVANDAMYNNVSNNVLTSYGITYGHGTRSTPPLLLSDAHYNYIGDNVINCDDANAIYLSSYGGGPLTGGESYFNTIHNNVITYNVLPTSWGYGIQVMGRNNTISSNRITGAYRGVSTMASGNVIVDNWIINLTGADFNNPGVPSGGEIAIVGSSYSTIKNNHIVNAKVISTGAGITVLDNSTVENNFIEVSLQGKGIHPKGSNIIIKNNTISTDSGSGILYNIKAFNLEVLDNNISSKTGIGVLIQKEKDKKLPGNITIVGNTIATDNKYAIDAAEADASSVNIIGPNNIKMGCMVKTPGGSYDPSKPADTFIVAPDVTVAYKDTTGELVATITNVYGSQMVVDLDVSFNGEAYTVKTNSNGKISIPIGILTPGNYSATFSYKGNGNYNPSSTTANVVVSKANTFITAPDVTVVYGDTTGELVATITNEYGKALTVNLDVNLNGERFTLKSNSKGQITMPIKDLPLGSYIATISYKGNVNYNPSSATANVIVKTGTVIVAQDVTVAYKDTNGKLLAIITDAQGNGISTNLNVKLNKQTYTVQSDSNGQINMSIGVLTPGNYAAIISYDGDDTYAASSTTANVIVNKADTVIVAPDVTVAFKDTTGELVATIINAYGSPMVVDLDVSFNGETYAVKTNSKGKISIPIGVLSPGNYVATVSYKGNGNYKASSTNVNVVVNKADTVIVAQDVYLVYKGNKSNLVATITNSYGSPMVVNLDVSFNGEMYSVKTNSKGKISIPINVTRPGSYVATISYKGNNNYNPTTTTANIIINKANTQIDANDVSVDYGDSKGKLIATLTNEFGNAISTNVYVTLDGVTTKYTTDANGQIRIKTEKLSKGTHQATITYKGNNNYNPTTTIANITVK